MSWQENLLAEPNLNRPDKMDAIIGVEEEMLGQNTDLGWILSDLINDDLQITSMIVCSCEDQFLTKFWELEELAPSYNWNYNYQKCESFHTTTTIWNTDRSRRLLSD